jgi:hypothetical protein
MMHIAVVTTHTNTHTHTQRKREKFCRNIGVSILFSQLVVLIYDVGVRWVQISSRGFTIDFCHFFSFFIIVK